MATHPIDEHATYGVYDAKTQFASIVDRAFHGEIITITKHGVPVAQISPIPPRKMTPQEILAANAAMRNSEWAIENPDWRELVGRDEH